MPQKTFPDITVKESGMSTFLKTVVVIALLLVAFGVGYYTASSGYRVVDSQGAAVVKSNAAQIVKDENSRLGREVVGKSEEDAQKMLTVANRTLFVGVKDGTTVEYKGQKTFTNLTVEVKDGKIIKVLGWY